MCYMIMTIYNKIYVYNYVFIYVYFNEIINKGSARINVKEFSKFGYLFNINKASITKIFKEFDVNGDNLLNYKVIYKYIFI